jgi:hypothetical protein
MRLLVCFKLLAENEEVPRADDVDCSCVGERDHGTNEFPKVPSERGARDDDRVPKEVVGAGYAPTCSRFGRADDERLVRWQPRKPESQKREDNDQGEGARGGVDPVLNLNTQSH